MPSATMPCGETLLTTCNSINTPKYHAFIEGINWLQQTQASKNQADSQLTYVTFIEKSQSNIKFSLKMKKVENAVYNLG